MYTQERRRNYYSRCSVVAAAAAPCPGDAVFHCETFLCFQKRTQLESEVKLIYNTGPERFNPNIRVCAAHFTETVS